MNPDDFIRKNIIKKLMELGYQEGGTLEFAADEGLSHFRRCSQASRRGAIFDDCYHVAKTWIEKYGHKQPEISKRRTK
ncbi:hypothetical protein NVI2019_PEGOAJLN_00688 [Providencia alcalifaciens]|uniref:hypothetical protein n=1 Tax=Providencia alcalifaciens TaxID=126385 RepID=UPI001CC41977|nr:hypothetical protein NVI2019_PEGOAJLN_00688 [Providencia alcalifaciens]